MEAESAGLPVIANNKDGIPETVAPDGGFIANTPQEYVEKIKFLLSNPKIAKCMGQKAQKFAYNNFRWDVIIMRYMKEWNNKK